MPPDWSWGQPYQRVSPSWCHGEGSWCPRLLTQLRHCSGETPSCRQGGGPGLAPGPSLLGASAPAPESGPAPDICTFHPPGAHGVSSDSLLQPTRDSEELPVNGNTWPARAALPLCLEPSWFMPLVVFTLEAFHLRALWVTASVGLMCPLCLMDTWGARCQGW